MCPKAAAASKAVTCAHCLPSYARLTRHTVATHAIPSMASIDAHPSTTITVSCTWSIGLAQSAGCRNEANTGLHGVAHRVRGSIHPWPFDGRQQTHPTQEQWALST